MDYFFLALGISSFFGLLIFSLREGDFICVILGIVIALASCLIALLFSPWEKKSETIIESADIHVHEVESGIHLIWREKRLFLREKISADKIKRGEFSIYRQIFTPRISFLEASQISVFDYEGNKLQ